MNRNMRKMYTEEQIAEIVKKNSKCLVSGNFEDTDENVYIILPTIVENSNTITANVMDVSSGVLSTQVIDFENQTIGTIQLNACAVMIQNVITGETLKSIDI